MRTLVVVPVLNGEDCLGDCLDALLATDDPHLKVVVVDDGSSDRSMAMVRQRVEVSAGRLSVVDEGRCGGFAAAVNRGVDRGLNVAVNVAPPELLVLVNQDCVVSEGWLAPLVAALEDPIVAVAGARLFDADGVTLQHAGARLEANALTSHWGRGSRDPLAWRELRDVDYVCGALFALRTSTWLRFGPFDEGYAPAYFEEVDFCVTVRRAGKRVVYVPDSEAVHLEAFSSGAGSATFLQRYHRNRLRFVVRHGGAGAGLWKWALAELSWLSGLKRWSEVAPVLAAYARVPLWLVELWFIELWLVEQWFIERHRERSPSTRRSRNRAMSRTRVSAAQGGT